MDNITTIISDLMLADDEMKDLDILMNEETLFRDEGVFTPNHVPEDFMHRDAQLQELMLSLKPGLRGVNPINTLVNGPAGTGKTTSVKYVFEKLAETSKKLVPVYINCEDFSTPYSIFARIYQSVYGISPPSTGKPLEDIKERVFTRLKKDNRGLVVALDEIDRLFLEKKIDRVLVDLLKAYTTYGFDRVGVIGITINDAFMADLDEKTRSIYNPKRVYFDPYDPGQIRDILSNRVKYGLYDGVLGEGQLDRIVGNTCEKGGDLRVGIELIRRSALNAEQAASRRIRDADIDKAWQELPKIKKDEAEGKLSDDERILLEIITAQSGKTSGHYFMKFREQTGSGVKKYNEIIQKLERQKLIETAYKEGVRGRTREIRIL